MPILRKLGAKEVALIACFAALYVVLSYIPMSRLIGASQSITLAEIIAPLSGIILGAYLGAISTFLGGIVSLSINPSFSQMGLVAGVFGAVCAGLLYTNRRTLCALTYLTLLLVFGLYPTVGPVWTFPQVMWFQIVGFLILISPLQAFASRSFGFPKAARLLFAFFVTSLTSTLAAQIAGNIIFETLYFPTITPAIWILVTVVYPFERTIIAVMTAIIAVPLFEAVKTTNLINANQRLKK
jgi:hypothetical protein